MKTKFFSLIILSLIVGTPLAAFADGGTFSLNGTINGFEGEFIHFLYQKGNEMGNDSVKITDGRFAFSGNINAPMEMRTLAVGNINDRENVKFCYLYIEPKTMKVSINKDDFSNPAVTGSLSQAQADSLKAIQNKERDLMTKLREEQKATTDSVRIMAIDRQIDECQDRMLADMVEWVKTHTSSLIVPMQMRLLMGNMTYGEIDSIYSKLTPEVKKMPECKEIEDELKALKLIQPGEPAPYFRARSDKGEMISPADLRGKYVLLDFWATWCVPCRKNFPHVKALYDKYKGKGFDVFCVADDDGNESRWKVAIKKDGIENFHHVLRGLKWDRSKGLAGMDKTNDISDKYAVHYLPTKYLIDPEGRMVGKFNDEELDVKLKTIFGY